MGLCYKGTDIIASHFVQRGVAGNWVAHPQRHSAIVVCINVLGDELHVRIADLQGEHIYAV